MQNCFYPNSTCKWRTLNIRHFYIPVFESCRGHHYEETILNSRSRDWHAPAGNRTRASRLEHSRKEPLELLILLLFGTSTTTTFLCVRYVNGEWQACEFRFFPGWFMKNSSQKSRNTVPLTRKCSLHDPSILFVTLIFKRAATVSSVKFPYRSPTWCWPIHFRTEDSNIYLLKMCISKFAHWSPDVSFLLQGGDSWMRTRNWLLSFCSTYSILGFFCWEIA